MCQFGRTFSRRLSSVWQLFFPFDTTKVDIFSIASNYFFRFIRFSALFLIYVKNLCAHTPIYFLTRHITCFVRKSNQNKLLEYVSFQGAWRALEDRFKVFLWQFFLIQSQCQCRLVTMSMSFKRNVSVVQSWLTQRFRLNDS